MLMRGVQPKRTDAERQTRLSWTQRYRSDPAQYVLDVFDFREDEPSQYQLDVLMGLVETGKEAMRGPRGAGKSAVAAWAIHWFADMWDGLESWMVIATASVWSQLTKFLWPQVHKWSRQKRWDSIPVPKWVLGKQLQKRSLELSTGQAFLQSPANFEAGEGAHEDHLLYIFDEAKLIKEEVFNSVEGAMSTNQHCLQLALSTPGESAGPFYDICRKAPAFADWNVREVSLEEAVAAGRVSGQWAQDRLERWGADHPMYQQYVLGRFASLQGNNLIPLTHVELAQARFDDWNRTGRLTALGVDLGEGTGGDESVIAKVYDGTKVVIERYKNDGLAKLEDRIIEEVKGNKQLPIYLDAIGIGAGVAASLQRWGYAVRPFVSSWGTTLKDESDIFGYATWRAAGWYVLKAMLDPANPWHVGVVLPDDEDLRADITAVKASSMTARQQYRIEPKERLKKELGRSPDAGDAVMMALTGPVLWAAKQDETPAVRWEYRPATV